MSLIKRSTPRSIDFICNINPYVAGSVLASFGNTKVHITATIEDSVPQWLKGKGQGWVTAEYSMLPSSTHTRSQRERKGVSGRTQEIQRLIGRSLRSIVDLKKLGETSIIIDCDVLIADGGTRTTSITGAYLALRKAVDHMLKEGIIQEDPIKEPMAAVSVGIDANGEILADLNYIEDSNCCTDMNIVMTKSNRFIEIQGTAEKESFSSEQLTALLDAASKSLEIIFAAQEKALR